MSVGALEIELYANMARLQRDLQQAKGMIGNTTAFIEKSVSAAKNVLSAVGLGLSAGAFAGWIKGAIDAADAAGKLSQKTGLAVQDVAGIELAYQQAGLGSDVLTSSMSKLSKQIVEGGRGLKALDVQTKAVDGSFRSNKEVLYDLADRFAKMEDGAQKAALAQEVFGKTGTDMIPMLNGGSAALREMDEMARKLGLTMSAETAADAEKFNDTLDLLQMGGQGVARGIAAELLPTLSNLAGEFLTSMTEGDKLKNTAEFLATALKLLYTVALCIVEVFSTIGKTVGAAGAQLVAILQGDFASAARIGQEWSADVEKGWAKTAKSIAAAWSSEGNAAVESQAATMKAQRDLLASQREREAAAKKAEQAYEAAKNKATNYVGSLELERAKIGLTADEITMMTAAREAAAAPTTELADKIMATARAVIAEKAAWEDLAAAQKLADDEAQKRADASAAAVRSAKDEADKNEELVRTFGMSKAAIEEMTIARLEEQLRQEKSIHGCTLEAAKLEDLIAARKRNATAMGELDALEANKKALEETRSMWESIDEVAFDTFSSIWNSGKNTFDRLKDTLKNGLFALLYQMTVKRWLVNISASVSGAGGLAGAAQAATGGGAGGGAGSMLGSVAGGLFGAGGLSGALMGGAGWLTGVTTLSGALSAGASLVGTGTVAGAASGMGMIAGALGPIALGIAAVLAIAKRLDTSGTKHTGAASMATSAGVSAVSAESLGMANIALSGQVSQLTSGLASGVVNILNSTAAAFGKTAGYSAATAFADDTSKDGAWGALAIKRMGETVVDWNNSRNSTWAPREYADGDAGQKQYLTDLSRSVRSALDGIGLPIWAKDMLTALGDAPALEDIAKTVDQINAVQTALAAVGDSIGAFASMSDQAVAALVKAAGGVDALVSDLGAFYEGYYTEAEKIQRTFKGVEEALKAVGLEMPRTRAEYRAMVEQSMAMGESGAAATAVLLRHAAAFGTYADAAESATAAAGSLTVALTDSKAVFQEAAEIARAAADSSMARLSRSVSAEKARLEAAYEKEAEAIRKRADAAAKAAQVHADAAADQLQAIQSVFGALDGAVKQLRPMSMDTARATLDAALAHAKGGGSLANYAGLEEALRVAASPDQATYATMLDFQRDQARTASTFAALRDRAGAQVSVAQLTLNAANKVVELIRAKADAELVALAQQHGASIGALDSILSAAQQQIDALNDVDNSVVSIATAIADLSDAVMAAIQAKQVANQAGTPTGGAPATPLTVDALYRQVLGRAPEHAGLEFWSGAFGTSIDAAEVAQFLKAAAPELASKGGTGSSLEAILRQAGVPGFLDGGDHLGGVRIVGEQGIELEATGRSRIFNSNQLMSMLRGSSGDEGLASEVREMRKSIERLQVGVDKTAKATTSQESFMRMLSPDGNSIKVKVTP